jgi:hypothetical protein
VAPALPSASVSALAPLVPKASVVRQSGADVIGSYFTFENDLGIFARQLRQLGVQAPCFITARYALPKSRAASLDSSA